MILPSFGLWLFACTPAPEPSMGDDGVVRLDPDGPYAYQPPWCEEWGVQVGAGIDVDHDGVQEWLATAPSMDFRTQFLEVREDGVEATGRSWESTSMGIGYSVASGGDTDGDGFGEYLVSHQLDGGETWMQLVRGSDPAGDIRLLLPEDYRSFTIGPTAFVHVDGRDQVLMTSFVLTTRWRVDLFDLEGVAPGSDVVAGDDTLVFADDPLDNAIVGTVVAVDVDGDGVDEWLGGRAKAYEEGQGDAWVCPARIGLQIPEDCEVVGGGQLNGFAGARQAAGDLDGDGRPELVTTHMLAPLGGDRAQGVVSVVDADGRVRARIEGTRHQELGGHPLIYTGDDGTTWLLVHEMNTYGYATVLYGFRADQLMAEDGHRVELTDQDAAMQWSTGYAAALGWSMATYRPTPEAPLQLVIGEPWNGPGVVYVIDAP